MTAGSAPGGRRTMRDALDLVLRDAVAGRVTPGGVLAVVDGGRVVDVVPFGRTQREPDDGEVVTAGTIYDVASLTKPMASLALVMRLCDAGRLSLDAPARSLVPELTAPGTEAITMRHLVGHSAGLPDHVPFYERLWAGDDGGAPSAREALVRMAGATELRSAPGAETLYSDVGYILLGAALERAGGARLDELARALVLEPLEMGATRYVDLAGPRAPLGGLVAPTEVCARRGLVRGEVHDENAHAGGGVCGHAGLFSTADDVARFGCAVAAALCGDAGLFVPSLARILATTRSTPSSTWRLGWDSPSATSSVSHAGDLWPRDGIGHLGFTGCSLWIDGPRRRAVVLLTNRVHPTRQGTGIGALRRAVMDTVVRALDGGTGGTAVAPGPRPI